MLREAVAPVKAPSPPQQDMTASLGRVEWHAVPWPEPGALDAGRWLLLADDSGLATALAARLRAVGAEVIEVRPGVATGLNGACRHIAADDPEEWRRLFAAAGPLAGVVHLWGLDFLADPAIADLDRMLAQGIGPMLAAARHRKESPESAPLWIVTAGAAGPGTRNPAAASLWGMARVQHAEQPGLIGGVIDIGTPHADQAEAVMRFLSAASTGDRRRVVRDGTCLAERCVRLPAAATPPTQALDPHRAYLITGGLGALGLVVARALVRWGARRLVLVGRRIDRSSALADVDQLRAAGVAVEACALDIADPQALGDLLARLDAKDWSLGGIVHAAGVLDDGLISGLTPQRVRDVLKPKVAGAINLHQLTRGRSLDFFISFSSIAAISEGVGQGAYAAANAFLDALAENRQQQGLPACSLQWGPWAAGMGSGLDPGRLASCSLRQVSAEEGMNLLSAALARSEPTLIAAAADWAKISGRTEHAKTSTAGSSSAAWLVGLDRADAEERRTMLSTYLDRVIRGLLLLPEAEPLSARQSLLELGLDSITATNLRNRLAADTGVEMPLDALLAGPSREQLVEVIGHRFALSRVAATTLSASDDHNTIEEFVL